MSITEFPIVVNSTSVRSHRYLKCFEANTSRATLGVEARTAVVAAMGGDFETRVECTEIEKKKKRWRKRSKKARRKHPYEILLLCVKQTFTLAENSVSSRLEFTAFVNIAGPCDPSTLTR